MADEDGLTSLRERLQSHSNCFNSLLELIPPKYYLNDNQEEQGNKFYKNKKQKAPKQAVKEASKKAKLSRLDPSKHKSLVELQTESANEESSRAKDENRISVENVACSDIGDLRTKLHQRIELLRKKRKAGSTIKCDGERPAKKPKKNIKEEKNCKKFGSNVAKVNVANSINDKKVIRNSNGKLVFSKFDFTSEVIKTATVGKGKKKNYKKLLEKAEDRQKKLQEIKATGTEKANEIVEHVAWKKALVKSEGVKQKDDPALLKKAMKRKEKQKSKHQKEWKARVENQKKQIREKQELREKNIRERIENKKKKKMKKKGGRTPGF